MRKTPSCITTEMNLHHICELVYAFVSHQSSALMLSCFVNLNYYSLSRWAQDLSSVFLQKCFVLLSFYVLEKHHHNQMLIHRLWKCSFSHRSLFDDRHWSMRRNEMLKFRFSSKEAMKAGCFGLWVTVQMSDARDQILLDNIFIIWWCEWIEQSRVE